MKQCPICETELTDPMPAFCPSAGCGWELKQDLTLVPSLDLPENIIQEYRQKLTVTRLNWKERIDGIRKRTELEQLLAKHLSEHEMLEQRISSLETKMAEQFNEFKAAVEQILAQKAKEAPVKIDEYKPKEIEVSADGRFIAYDNGTVLDRGTGLMWAASDNGEDIDWNEADFYCRSYRAGGNSDWRMPNPAELVGLYDPKETNPLQCHVIHLIKISSNLIWSSEKTNNNVYLFNFMDGKRFPVFPQYGQKRRVLPVRLGK